MNHLQTITNEMYPHVFIVAIPRKSRIHFEFSPRSEYMKGWFERKNLTRILSLELESFNQSQIFPFPPFNLFILIPRSCGTQQLEVRLIVLFLAWQSKIQLFLQYGRTKINETEIWE